jgi:glucose/arabinose dehydrogenase
VVLGTGVRDKLSPCSTTPMHQSGKTSGEYADFLTGFVLANGQVWGRPVGVTTALDGSLLVTDDGSNSIWRISYVGE